MNCRKCEDCPVLMYLSPVINFTSMKLCANWGSSILVLETLKYLKLVKKKWGWQELFCWSTVALRMYKLCVQQPIPNWTRSKVICQDPTCKPGVSDAINISSPFSTSCRLLESPPESLPPGPAAWKAIAVNADDEDSPGGKGESSRRKPNTLPQCANDCFPSHPLNQLNSKICITSSKTSKATGHS